MQTPQSTPVGPYSARALAVRAAATGAADVLTQGDTVQMAASLDRMADRYQTLIASTHVTEKFTPAEMNALRDCCLGAVFEPAQLCLGSVLMTFQDSEADGLFAKWNIDGQATASKLAALTDLEQFALIESIEQWWRETACAHG